MNIAERIYEAVKELPIEQAAEVLDFADFLQAKLENGFKEGREKALATLDKHKGLYDGKPFNRDECYER